MSVPDAPTFTSSPVVVDSTTITVAFTLGSNGGSALTDIQYARDTDGYTAWTTLGLAAPLEGQTTATITGLTAPVSGNYKLRSVNGNGESSPSAAGVAPIWYELNTVRYFNGTISTDNQRIVAVHWNPSINNAIDYSSDGGATWSTVPDFGNVNKVVSSLSGQIVLALADGVAPHLSTNYGATFTATSLSTYYGDYPQYNAVMNASGTLMMTVDSVNGYIYVSTDSGANWSNPYQFTDGFTSLFCSSLSMDRIYAVTYPSGGSGTIYVSTNMGATWTSLGNNPSTSILNDMACDWSGQNVVISVGSDGVYRSTNGGVSWVQTTAPLGGNMRFIASNNTGNRILVSNDATPYGVYVSLDAGATWSMLSTPGTDPLLNNIIQGVMISPDGSLSISGLGDTTTYFQSLGAADLPLLPGPPSFTSSITVVDSTTISFDFVVGYPGASALTAIQYARSTDNYATWTTITGLSTPLENATSATITGLTPSSAGSYKIRSVNSAGSSAPSDAMSAYQVINGEYYPKVLFSSNNQYAIARKFNDGGSDEAAVSSDGGITWTAVAAPGGVSVNDVAMSLDGTIMYYTASASGTYKSTNYGATFSLLSAAPLNPMTIVCNSTGQRVFVYSDNDTSIYASNDAGATFTQGANLGNFVVSMACNASGDHLYLIDGLDAYKSTDYGQTFTIMTLGLYGETVSSIACNQSGQLIFISVSSGGLGVIVSVDYGVFFYSTIINSNNSDNYTNVVCDSIGNRVVALSTNGTIRVSYNSGTTWAVVPPIPGRSLTFTSGGVSISPDGTRYVSSLGAPGTFITVEGTPDTVSVWRVIDDVYYFNGSISTNNQRIVARNYNTGTTVSTVVYSSDAGMTWTDVASFGDVYRVVASASGETVLAIMNDGTLPHVSTNYGATFTITTMAPVGSTPNQLAVIDSTGASMMAIADDGHVYVSTNSGVNWTNPYQFTDGNNFRAMCASQTMDHVYVLFNSNTDGLWYIYGSIDMGLTWTSVSVSPSPSETFDIACDWSGQKLVLAGGDSGIYRSTDSGITWTQLQLPVINYAYILSPRKIVSNSTGNRIAFIDPWNWYMSLVSIDAGATWSPLTSPDPWFQQPQGNIISPDGSFIMSAVGANTYVQTLGAADLPPGPATVPDAPTFTSSPTIVSNTSISIVFSLGSNGGSDLTDLEYARDTDSYATWTSLGLSLPLEGQTTATITGLTGPSTGSYKLRSVNAVGNSDPSTEGIAQPIAPAAPSFTSTPTAVNTTSINIAFSLGFNGGLALMDLEYARDTDSYATWTSVGLSLPLEGQTTATITGLTAPVTGNYKLRSVNDVGNSVASAAGLVSGTIPCFLEGSKILCQVDGVEKYVAVETIRPGTLVKTSLHGFQPVKLIGSRPVVNVGGDIRDKNSLYLCTKANYPELTEDLVITGCHAILVNHITDAHRQGIINTLERVFVTDKKYRLPACVDERAAVHQATGDFTVWHFALEHTDIKMNYGVYAQGLLVESSPIWHMNTKNYNLVQ